MLTQILSGRGVAVRIEKDWDRKLERGRERDFPMLVRHDSESLRSSAPSTFFHFFFFFNEPFSALPHLPIFSCASFYGYNFSLPFPTLFQFCQHTRRSILARSLLLDPTNSSCHNLRLFLSRTITRWNHVEVSRLPSTISIVRHNV